MREYHIGQRIKQVFRERFPDMTVEELGEMLNMERQNVHNIFKRASINTEQLMLISTKLQHDFFVEMSTELHRNIQERGDELFAPKELYRKALYDNIMLKMQREVGRAITESQFGGPASTVITLNPSRGLRKSATMSISEYRVYVIDGEKRYYPPHVHIVVQKDKANIRIDIETGELLGVVNQGYRDTSDSFDDVVDLAKQWLDEPSFYEPGQTNREVARTHFHKINPNHTR